jgi:Family of unknown function (DUF6166)
MRLQESLVPEPGKSLPINSPPFPWSRRWPCRGFDHLLDEWFSPCYPSMVMQRQGEFGVMKFYQGMRTERDGYAVLVDENGESRSLDPRFDLRRHSPDGFAWGFSGSGPAQLALALAADVLRDDEQAQSIYQALKFRLIAGLPQEGWSLSEERIRQAIDQLAQTSGRAR